MWRIYSQSLLKPRSKSDLLPSPTSSDHRLAKLVSLEAQFASWPPLPTGSCTTNHGSLQERQGCSGQGGFCMFLLKRCWWKKGVGVEGIDLQGGRVVNALGWCEKAVATQIQKGASCEVNQVEIYPAKSCPSLYFKLSCIPFTLLVHYQMLAHGLCNLFP